MKIKHYVKIAAPIVGPVLFVVLLTILSVFIILSPVYAASSSGNTTVYDYDTNASLTAGALVNYNCNASGLNAALTIDVDPYVGTDELELIKAYYRASNGSAIEENLTDYDFENRTRVVLDLNSTHSYNLTYVASDSSWQGRISSNESEDTTLIFKANSKSYVCLNATTTIKFRPAFYLTLRFYKGSNMTTDVSTSSYKNEFQYVYMRFVNASLSYTDSTIFRDMSYLDRMFGWMPFYKPTFSSTSDDALTFWAHYNNGEARIKLYEAPQNYSIHLQTDDTYGLTWTDEFTRPQLQDSSWKSKPIPKLRIAEAEDKTLSVYLSRWEVHKFLFLMNIGYWLLIIIGWVVIMMVAGSHLSWKAMVGVSIGYLALMRAIGLAIF